MTSWMEEPSTSFHLQLNEQSFSIPYELLQKNYKQFNSYVERQSALLKKKFADLNTLLLENTLENNEEALTKLNALIKSVNAFEKHLNERVERERELLNRIEKRIQFYNELQTAKESSNGRTLLDWYQKYTNLLIADYLTRNCSPVQQDNIKGDNEYAEDDEETNPGVIFLKQQHMEKLLDYDILLAANRISSALINRNDLEPLMEWIKEKKYELTKRNSILEFKANFQKYIELLFDGNLSGAIQALQTKLFQYMGNHFEEVTSACGLLVYMDRCLEHMPNKEIFKTSRKEYKDHNINEPAIEGSGSVFTDQSKAYEYFFHRRIPMEVPSESRTVKLNNLNQLLNSKNLDSYSALLDNKSWVDLNNLFLNEYYSIYRISKNDPLLIYISLGASTLKTKECLHDHSMIDPQYNVIDQYSNRGLFSNQCPVCSEYFAPLSENLPHAHHTESKLFDNPIMLPNGNVYDAQRLKMLAKILIDKNIVGLKTKEILDPIDKCIYNESDFITMYPT